MLGALFRGIETAGISAEILVVDGRSTDSTNQICLDVDASWRRGGLLASIEEGKTGLEGIQFMEFANYSKSKNGKPSYWDLIHYGVMRSVGTFVMFVSQDILMVRLFSLSK